MKTPEFRFDLAHGDVPRAVFIARALERALRFVAVERWETELVTLDHLVRLLEGEVLIDVQLEDLERVVLEVQHAVMSVALDRSDGTPSSVSVEVWASSRQAGRLEVARLKELIPIDEAKARRRTMGFVTEPRR